MNGQTMRNGQRSLDRGRPRRTTPKLVPCRGTYRFTFGRHCNRTLEQVHEKDPGYLDWMSEQGDFGEDIQQVIRGFLVLARGKGQGRRQDIRRERSTARAIRFSEGRLTPEESARLEENARLCARGEAQYAPPSGRIMHSFDSWKPGLPKPPWIE